MSIESDLMESQIMSIESDLMELREKSRLAEIRKESQATTDARDMRDPAKIGASLFRFRARAPRASLSSLYDRHSERLTAAALDADR